MRYVLIGLIHCKVVRCRYTGERENTCFIYPMETCDSILLKIHRLTNDVYF